MGICGPTTLPKRLMAINVSEKQMWVEALVTICALFRKEITYWSSLWFSLSLTGGTEGTSLSRHLVGLIHLKQEPPDIIFGMPKKLVWQIIMDDEFYDIIVTADQQMGLLVYV